MVFSTVNQYILPDGTLFRARAASGVCTLEWRFEDAVSGEPLYLLDRDGRTMLAYVFVSDYHGYILAPSDLQIDDVRIVYNWQNEET